MPFGHYLQAEYESGYVHTETDLDQSSFRPGSNFFCDILNGLPTEAGHGKMTKFRLLPVNGDLAYEVDWTKLPFNARPIYWRRMSRVVNSSDDEGNLTEPAICQLIGFGYQYTDENGENIQHVEEIT
jgi:hypothetical protein